MRWAALLQDSACLDLYQSPELDIVCYYPVTSGRSAAAIDAASARVLQDGMAGPDPTFLSTLRVSADALRQRHPEVSADADGARILRSVLMKPEHEAFVPQLHERIEQLARAAG